MGVGHVLKPSRSRIKDHRGGANSQSRLIKGLQGAQPGPMRNSTVPGPVETWIAQGLSGTFPQQPPGGQAPSVSVDQPSRQLLSIAA